MRRWTGRLLCVAGLILAAYGTQSETAWQGGVALGALAIVVGFALLYAPGSRSITIAATVTGAHEPITVAVERGESPGAFALVVRTPDGAIVERSPAVRNPTDLVRWSGSSDYVTVTVAR